MGQNCTDEWCVKLIANNEENSVWMFNLFMSSNIVWSLPFWYNSVVFSGVAGNLGALGFYAYDQYCLNFNFFVTLFAHGSNGRSVLFGCCSNA